MTDQASQQAEGGKTTAGTRPEGHEPSSVGQLNERTAKRQRMLLAGIATVSGAGNVDVYAQTRADIQTERTYSSIANSAMKWVPLLNVVLTVLFYALFPVLSRR